MPTTPCFSITSPHGCSALPQRGYSVAPGGVGGVTKSVLTTCPPGPVHWYTVAVPAPAGGGAASAVAAVIASRVSRRLRAVMVGTPH